MFAEEVNKIALSSNDNKRIQTFDGVITYPYGANAFKVWESEMMTTKKKAMMFAKKETMSIKLYYNKK